MGLSWKLARTESGTIITAKNATPKNDGGRFFQVGELGVLNLAIHLGHGFLAAHGEDGVSQSDQNTDERNRVRQRRVVQPSQSATVRPGGIDDVAKIG
jgi:hypothetical protein